MLSRMYVFFLPFFLIQKVAHCTRKSGAFLHKNKTRRRSSPQRHRHTQRASVGPIFPLPPPALPSDCDLCRVCREFSSFLCSRLCHSLPFFRRQQSSHLQEMYSRKLLKTFYPFVISSVLFTIVYSVLISLISFERFMRH